MHGPSQRDVQGVLADRKSVGELFACPARQVVKASWVGASSSRQLASRTAVSDTEKSGRGVFSPTGDGEYTSCRSGRKEGSGEKREEARTKVKLRQA